MFYLVQAGDALQVVTQSGTVFATIDLPSGVTIDATLEARIAVLTQQVIVANAVSTNIWIDPSDFTARILGIPAPGAAGTASTGGSGALTGDYAYVFTYIQKIGGIVVNESPPAPLSNVVTLAAEQLAGTITVSAEADVTGRRVYRTAADGTDLFFSIDVDDNTSTSFTDDTPDLALSALPLDLNRSNAPAGSDGSSHMRLLVQWKDRLWGVSDDPTMVDSVFFTELDQIYAWSPFNEFTATPKGNDEFGVTGFIARRDALGICKRSRIIKITGSDEDDFQILIVYEDVGCVASDSIVVIRDAGYFLGYDGVYRWDDNGVTCVSRDKVDPWFTTDTVFDRTQFGSATGAWNPRTNSYELQLVPAGGSAPTAWVSYELTTGQWFGPHLTSAFAPSCRALLRSDDAVLRPAIGGSDGFLYLQNQAGGADVDGPTQTSHAIDAFFTPRWFSQGDPNRTHYFGRLALLSRVEGDGALTVDGALGVPGNANPWETGGDVAAMAPLSFDLTLGREVGGRAGVGNALELTFSQAVVGQQFLVYGFQILDGFDLGVR